MSSSPLFDRASTNDARQTADQAQAEKTPGAAVVSVENASARVGGRTIWSDVSLRLEPGQFTAVLGPNGAGKSTLLKAVLGLQPLTGGRITVLGGEPGRHNGQIGYLPQRRAFDSRTGIRGTDIVRLGLDGARWGVPLPRWLSRTAAARQQQVGDVLALVGASEYADRPIGESSGGEQQRLLIAQALIRRPRLLILDEPLDSLDVTNQAGVSALIQRICREQQVAVLLVAHDVNPILPYLDQVVYVARGGAVSGAPEEVITADTLSMLYDTPVEVLRDRAGRLIVVGQPDIAAEHRR